jgi:histidyl-tRNA synthetase
MNTLATPKGFRDFLPKDARARQFVAGRVRATFEKYGFEPLETPTIEYASVLLGKYGEEADKLVFRFTDRGDRDVALRYDQTVPTARVLAQYQNDLPRYFRRYQIQNVFRAEKPQRGRYREFTQCDIDIFGSTCPVSDAEILACTYDAFKAVGFPTVTIKYNDRKILFETLAPYAGEQLTVLSIIQTIDKLDKIGDDGVVAELTAKGLPAEKAADAIGEIRRATPTEALMKIVAAARSLGLPETALQFDPSLARGLDYYTELIFEVVVPEYPVGSMGGGGRYDNLIKQLGDVDMPAVGIAFGFDRMVEAATALGLIPSTGSGAKVLVTLFDPTAQDAAASAAGALRAAGIRTELFPAFDKLEKQLKYADRTAIPYVLIIGEEERKNGVVQLKNMTTRESVTLTVQEAVTRLRTDSD